jgi:uncharacterized protein (DUF4415 family)
MNRKLSDRRVDFAAPPPLSAVEKAQLAALAAQDEVAVDLGDLPELGEDFWAAAERGRFYRPVKQSTTVRIDSDVLHWLKSKGRGYQTRINAILREAMLREGAGR